MTPRSDAVQRSPDEYDSLPEPLKLSRTREQFMWLSNDEKRRIIESECEPDVTE